MILLPSFREEEIVLLEKETVGQKVSRPFCHPEESFCCNLCVSTDLAGVCNFKQRCAISHGIQLISGIARSDVNGPWFSPELCPKGGGENYFKGTILL